MEDNFLDKNAFWRKGIPSFISSFETMPRELKFFDKWRLQRTVDSKEIFISESHSFFLKTKSSIIREKTGHKEKKTDFILFMEKC